MAPTNSKNPLPPHFAPSQLSTRTKNKDTRPGVVDKPNPRRTPAEMQAIREQKAIDKQEKERKREEAMKKAADIEDQQRQEDLKHTAESNLLKPQVVSFRPPVPRVAKDVEDEIGSTNIINNKKNSSTLVYCDNIEKYFSHPLFFRRSSSNQK